MFSRGHLSMVFFGELDESRQAAQESRNEREYC